MADLQPHYDTDRPNTVAALGLRWAALRGMLGSPLIEADEQRSLREELVQELQSIHRSVAEIAARNAIEVCAKIDVLGEVVMKAAGNDNDSAEALLASIRRDVMSLVPRGLVEQRSTVQIVRGAAPKRASEPSPEGSRSGEATPSALTQATSPSSATERTGSFSSAATPRYADSDRSN